MNYVIFFLILMQSSLLAESIMLKNGNFISGTISGFENDQYTIVEDGKKYVIDKKNIDLILIDEFQTGIYENEYKNFKYNCSITKPQRIFFIPKKMAGYNTSSEIHNLLIMSKKMIVDESESLVWLDIIKLKEKHSNTNNTEYIELCDTILRENYKGNTRFPGKISLINSYNAYVQKMTNNRDVYGKTMRFMMKQMIIVKENMAYVITCQEKFREFEKSEPEFDSIINSFKFIEALDTFSNIAYMHYFNKEYDKAIKYFQKAIEQQPHDAELYNRLGIMFTFVGDFKKARANFEKAHDLNMKNKLIQYNMEKTGNDNFTGLPFE